MINMATTPDGQPTGMDAVKNYVTAHQAVHKKKHKKSVSQQPNAKFGGAISRRLANLNKKK